MTTGRRRARRGVLAAAVAIIVGPGVASATAAGPWSTPRDLSTPVETIPSDPTVAVSPEGRTLTAWWRRDLLRAPLTDAVQLRTRPGVTGRFRSIAALSALKRTATAQPVAAAAGAGAAAVAWTVGGSSIGVRILRGVTIPAQSAEYFEGTGVRIRDLRIGIAATGAAVAVWSRDPPSPAASRFGDAVVRVATRPAGGLWGPATDLSVAGAAEPALAVASDGSAIIAWERAGVIEVSVRTATGRFTTPTAISSGVGSMRPAVAIHATGGAVAAWYQGGVMVAEQRTRNRFRRAVALTGASGLPRIRQLREPALAIGPGGRMMAAWRRVVNGVFVVEGAIHPAGGAWGVTQRLSVPVNRNAGHPSLALADTGRAVVAWSQPGRHNGSSIRARPVAEGSQTFGSVEVVSRVRDRGAAPTVGVDAAGRAVVVWRDRVAGRGHLFRTSSRPIR